MGSPAKHFVFKVNFQAFNSKPDKAPDIKLGRGEFLMEVDTSEDCMGNFYLFSRARCNSSHI